MCTGALCAVFHTARVVAADGVLAMDSGGVSDPFAVARWGALVRWCKLNR